MQNTYYRKAWTVIGYTFEGDVYCPECVAYTDPTVTGDSLIDTRVDQPSAVFASDESKDFFCTICLQDIC
jgi:hypothetical protein